MSGLALVVVLAVVALSLVLLVPAMQRQAEETRGRALDEVARALALERTPTGIGGVVDGFAVTLSRSTTRDGNRFVALWNLSVEDRGHRIAPGLTAGLRRDARLPDGAGLDRATGDRDLDARVSLRGDARWNALLDEETRRLLRGVTRQPTFFLVPGRIELTDYAGDGGEDGPRLAGILTVVLHLAKRLALPPGEVPGRLAGNAREDRDPRVRWRNLEVLAREFPERSECRAALRAALEDRHPEVRLRAADALREEGFDTLAALVRAPAPQRNPGWEAELQRAGGTAGGHLWWEIELADGTAAPPSPFDTHPGADEARRARALDILAARFPAARTLPLVRSALAGPVPLQVAALRASATIGDAADEGPLLAALASPDGPVRTAAIHALGAIGTAEAVAHLRALAEASPLSLALGRAAGAAIARIQARLVGAAAGQVALAGEGGAGRVALASGDAGALALAADDASAAGRLSLPADDGTGRHGAPDPPVAEGRG